MPPWSAHVADETRGSEPIQIGGIELRAGARVGAYIYVREIGSGGMARVILAKNPSGQRVALKVLRKSRIQHGLKRFHREFRALSESTTPTWWAWKLTATSSAIHSSRWSM